MNTPQYRIEVDGDRQDAYAVRWTVFVDEQGVDPDIEIDEHEDQAVHFVAYGGDKPVGAARLREPNPGVGKVERLAVVADYRGSGLGRKLIEAVERHARETGIDTLTLHGQVRVAEFYEHLGYKRVGEPFEEAGIPHVEMVKSLE